jgi:hypothetical protein
MVPLGDRRLTHDEAHRFSRTLTEQIFGQAAGPIDDTSSALNARDGGLFIDCPAQWPRHNCRRHLFPSSAPRIPDRSSHLVAGVSTGHPTGCDYYFAPVVESARTSGSSVGPTNGNGAQDSRHRWTEGKSRTAAKAVALTSGCRYLMC